MTACLHHVPQQGKGVVSGPLEVLEHQHERRVLARGLQQVDHRIEEHVTVGLRVGMLGHRKIGYASGQRRAQQRQQLAGMALDVPGQHLVGGALCIVRESLNPDSVRSADVLGGGAPAHRETGAVCLYRDVPHEAGLADPWLARYEHRLARALADFAKEAAESLLLTGAADIWERGQRSQRGRQLRVAGDRRGAERRPCHGERL